MKKLVSLDAERILSNCDEDKAFHTFEGQVVRTVEELLHQVQGMSEFGFRYHVNQDRNKNDFSDWIRDVFGDEELAMHLEGVMDQLAYAKIIEKRLKGLKKQLGQ